MLHQWYKKADQILSTSAAKKRFLGGGQKPALGGLEETLAEEIRNLTFKYNVM